MTTTTMKDTFTYTLMPPSYGKVDDWPADNRLREEAFDSPDALGCVNLPAEARVTDVAHQLRELAEHLERMAAESPEPDTVLIRSAKISEVELRKEEIRRADELWRERGIRTQEEQDVARSRYEAMNARVYAALEEAGIAPPHFVSFLACDYEPQNPEMPRDNLDDVPIQGPVRFVVFERARWGGELRFMSPLLTSPTWLEIAVQAEAMNRATRNRGHPYLVGVEKISSDGGVTTAEFVMNLS